MIAPTQLPTGPGCGVDLACQAGQAIGSVFQNMIAAVARAAAEVVVASAVWWAETDSINPLDPAVVAAQDATKELILLILVGSVLVQSIRMILSRKGEPLIMVCTGLLRYAATSALGLVVLQIALRAGDALASHLLDGAAENFALLMQDVLTSGDMTFLVLMVSFIAFVLSLVQWVLMAMRQAGLLVLAAMLPLAASGSLTRSTRGWLDKLIVWLIAMVAYKPAAAFIYYIGFSYLSSPAAANAGGVATMITGVMVLFLAVIAMPILLKFFAWSGTQIGGGGSGSGFLGAAGAISMARGQGRESAVDRAASVESAGPGSRAVQGSYSPSGAAPTAAAGGGSAAAGGSGAAAGAGAAGGGGAAAAAGPAGVAAAAVAAGAAAGAAAVRGAAGTMTGQQDGGGRS